MFAYFNAKLLFCSCSLQQKQLKVVAKDWTDDKTFQLRNDLFWAGLGGNYFLWPKTFQENE